ncbi:MAG: hypothetical protein WCZ27_02005 [Tissierellaceae bacterium]
MGLVHLMGPEGLEHPGDLVDLPALVVPRGQVYSISTKVNYNWVDMEMAAKDWVDNIQLDMDNHSSYFRIYNLYYWH